MTNTEMAILSLLAEKPRHGYEIEQTIEERGMREWTEIGFSSIYYILKKLLQSGLVEESYQPSEARGPGKKVYQLTETGKAMWYSSAVEILKSPAKAFRTLDLGLANLPLIPLPESIAAMGLYRQRLLGWIEHVAARAARPENQVDHVRYMFDLALTHYQAELDWLNRTLDDLERKKRNEN